MSSRIFPKIVLALFLLVGIISYAPTISAVSCTNGTKTGTCYKNSGVPTDCEPIAKANCQSNETCCASSKPNQHDKPGSSGGGGGIEVPPGTGLSELPIVEILATVLQWLIRVFLLLAVIGFVVTGIQFLIAMGSAYSDAAQSAKKNFGYSIIAVVVVGASYILITTIAKLLGGGE